jgi:fibronectin type 3 domain-containing protein
VGEILLPLPEDQFVMRADQILLVPSTGFSSYLQDHVFVIPDKSLSSLGSPIYSHVFRYAVRFINDKNRAAGLSNQVSIPPVPIPPPPEGLSAQVTEDFIGLNWIAPPENTDGSKPPRIAGYNIYRSEEAEKLSTIPLNREPVQNTGFEDRNFQFDKTYYYAVGTVGNLQNPYAESLPSKILTVVSRDVFPPAPPRDFNAILEGNSTILLWAPSAASDIAGYRLYRQEKGATTRQLLQNELITGLSFRDNQIEPGKSYEYSLQSLDTHGNASMAVQTEVEIR